MDELAVPLVRADGSAFDLTVTLGRAARVYCDEGTPPVVVLDLGHSQVAIEVVGQETDTARIAEELVTAAQRLRACLATASRASQGGA